MTKDTDRLDTICFGGEDWWYHNRGHIDMQLMRRFAKRGTLVYVNSLVMQKPNIREGSTFLKKVVRKTRSIFTGLKQSEEGFWVYSPFSLHPLAQGIQPLASESTVESYQPQAWPQGSFGVGGLSGGL